MVKSGPVCMGWLLFGLKTAEYIYDFGKRERLTLMQWKFEMGLEVLVLALLLKVGEQQSKNVLASIGICVCNSIHSGLRISRPLYFKDMFEKH